MRKMMQNILNLYQKIKAKAAKKMNSEQSNKYFRECNFESKQT